MRIRPTFPAVFGRTWIIYLLLHTDITDNIDLTGSTKFAYSSQLFRTNQHGELTKKRII